MTGFPDDLEPMDLGRPHRSLGMGVTGDVLVALAALGRPLSGRRVAARANASTTQVLKVLGDLVDAGVVIATPAPPSLLFELNRDHVLAPVVAAIASASNSWRERVVEAISRWEPPADAVVLFGSAATGVADDRSDIDLLVVRPVDVGADDDTWASQVAALATALPRWTGNDVDLLDLTAAELRRNRRLAKEIERDGVALFGSLAGWVRAR